MTRWAAGLTAVLAANALAKPVDVDLSVERAAYEAKARPRNIGLTLLGVSVAGYAGCGISAWYASSARTQLLLQQVPVDLGVRQDLVARGTAATAVSAVMMGMGIVLTAVAIYFLAVSF